MLQRQRDMAGAAGRQCRPREAGLRARCADAWVFRPARPRRARPGSVASRFDSAPLVTHHAGADHPAQGDRSSQPGELPCTPFSEVLSDDDIPAMHRRSPPSRTHYPRRRRGLAGSHRDPIRSLTHYGSFPGRAATPPERPLREVDTSHVSGDSGRLRSGVFRVRAGRSTINLRSRW